MRTAVLLLCVLIVGLVAGFLPRPLFVPDWRTPFEKAVADGDCQAATRILEILPEAGIFPEASKAKLELREKRLCDFPALSEQDAEHLEWMRKDPDFGDKITYLNERWRSSFLGSRIHILRGRVRLELSDIVEREYWAGRNAIRQCADQYPHTGGLNDLKLLAYAIKNHDVSVDQIKAIAREKKAACVRKIAASASLMRAAAKTQNDRVAIASLSRAIEVHLKTAPDQVEIYNTLSSNISEEEYAQAFPGVMSLEGEGGFKDFACWDDRLADMLLLYAIDCADFAGLTLQKFEGSEEKALNRAGIYAVYYSQRAKRLGWRDLQKADAFAGQMLSKDCYKTIVDMEAKDAAGHTDVRDFGVPLWPDGPGMVCAPNSD